jgi:FkbM family methyltransferase
MKTLLKSLSLLSTVFTTPGKLHPPRRRENIDLTRIIQEKLGRRGEVFIVQIGSNDGVTGDPVFPLLRDNPSWGALLVEPVPFLFEQLKRNYAGNKTVQFENVAVSGEAGKKSFHYVDPAARQHIPDLPFWFDQLGSFDRGHIIRHIGSALERLIVTTEVPALPLEDLFERHHVSRIDVLHIDAEGHDWIILQQLDQKRFRPEFILFEHKHLSKRDKRAAVDFLADDYRITQVNSHDYLCELR